ncbi:restriction endonuclease subunit S, partial [Collinsella intestinalis]|nr:restriction endonuclease subunit S [Collinsella intestinalis]
EWVRSVPRSWRVEPLKYHCSMFKGLPILKTDLVEEGEPVISYGQIHSKGNTGTHLDDSLLRFIPASRVLGSESSKLRRGDVVFADTSEDVEGIGNAALIDTDGDVYAGYHTVTCRPDQKSLSGRYLAYLARTDAWRYQLRNLAMGVKVFSITQAILRKSEVLLPPRDEQERIADFLDERCAAIDA